MTEKFTVYDDHLALHGRGENGRDDVMRQLKNAVRNGYHPQHEDIERFQKLPKRKKQRKQPPEVSFFQTTPKDSTDAVHPAQGEHALTEPEFGPPRTTGELLHDIATFVAQFNEGIHPDKHIGVTIQTETGKQITLGRVDPRQKSVIIYEKRKAQ